MYLISAKDFNEGKFKKKIEISEYQFLSGATYIQNMSASSANGGHVLFWKKSGGKPVCDLIYASIVEADKNKLIFRGVQRNHSGKNFSLIGQGDYILFNREYFDSCSAQFYEII